MVNKKIVKGLGSITLNDTFVFPKEAPLTKDEIENMVTYHNETLAPKYKKDRDYYTGQHPILDKVNKEDSKPDNRLVVNYPKFLVDTFNGFFIGLPPKINLEDETDNDKLAKFNNRVSFYDKLYEVSKQASMHGRGYLLAYQNEGSETGVAVYSPESSFMIYDDTVEAKPLAFVTYAFDDENKKHGTVFMANGQFDLNMVLIDPNVYKTVPAVEIVENEERQSIFANVLTLVDAINNALSQKANDVDYFADAYLKILNAELSEDDLKSIRDNRIINLSNNTDAKDVVVEFMEKPNADGEQENLINRLNNLIFQMSSVSNITDSVFGNADSGKALEYHLLSMRNLASSKERKLTQSLRSLYKIIFSAGTVLEKTKSDEWINLSFAFTRNIPSNLTDEAATAKSLQGIVSKETQLKTLSIVDNPKDEINKMSEENKSSAEQAQQSFSQYDFEKSDVNG